MGVGNKVLEMELHNHKNTVTLLNPYPANVQNMVSS